MVGVVARRATTALVEVSRALTRHLPTRAASWALLVFSCGTALSAALQRLLLTPDQGLQRRVELDVGELFAVATIASLVVGARRQRPALTTADRAVLVACALTWFLPEAHAVYAGMTLAGAWFVVTGRHRRLLAEIGQVWLALSIFELWSKLAFRLFYQAIEPYEVGLMAWAGRFAYPGLQASGVYLSTHPDWSIVMLEGCSAFHNLSLAALIWLCVLKIAGGRARPAAFAALAVSAVLIVAINVARILAMLPSPAAYHFWHDETGSVAVALASVFAAVMPIVIQVERAPCPAAPNP